MEAVILTVHTLMVLALIGVVLMQRSEGGALGMGAGAGGGFMTGRGAADALTRTTGLLAAGYFATSLVLAIMAGAGEDETDVINSLTGTDEAAIEGAPSDGTQPLTTEDILGTLGSDSASDAGDAAATETAEPDLDDAAAVTAPVSEADLLDTLESAAEEGAEAVLDGQSSADDTAESQPGSQPDE